MLHIGRTENLVRAGSYGAVVERKLILMIGSHFSIPQPFPLAQHWDLNEMGYVETMFGHQSEINAIDSWRKERLVTGGRDRTVSLRVVSIS